MNTAVFNRFARTCTYIPRAGDAFDLRYVERDPAIDQPSKGARYFLEVEVIPEELAVAPARLDEVEIDGIRYVVNKIVAYAFKNTLLTLHRKMDS